MAKASPEYHRGEMNIQEQTATYDVVMGLTKWGSLATAVCILFMTLLFCTATGFIGSATASVIMAVIGFAMLMGKPAH